MNIATDIVQYGMSMNIEIEKLKQEIMQRDQMITSLNKEIETIKNKPDTKD